MAQPPPERLTPKMKAERVEQERIDKEAKLAAALAIEHRKAELDVDIKASCAAVSASCTVPGNPTETMDLDELAKYRGLCAEREALNNG